jgi:mRNA-degrading endonuclease RelE of RelBE toxin-antitoxin system
MSELLYKKEKWWYIHRLKKTDYRIVTYSQQVHLLILIYYTDKA